MPKGTLKQALMYPRADCTATDQALLEVLNLCRLSHLCAMLEMQNDWLKQLSLGELQRLAFARVLLQDPKCVLLDEATSALDEPTEAYLYRLICERLPNSVIISVGHRQTLKPFHTCYLTLHKANSI